MDYQNMKKSQLWKIVKGGVNDLTWRNKKSDMIAHLVWLDEQAQEIKVEEPEEIKVEEPEEVKVEEPEEIKVEEPEEIKDEEPEEIKDEEPEEIKVEDIQDHKIEDNKITKYISNDITPMNFNRLFSNGGGDAVEDYVDLATYEGHIFRNADTKKFVIFDDVWNAGTWFNGLTKPRIHSVVNKHRPLRFNLELDIEYDKLDKIILPQNFVDKLAESGMSMNRVKYLLVVRHIKNKINIIMERNYKTTIQFIEATDNRPGKFSHRLYADVHFQNIREYKYFANLLKDEVREDHVSMIDITTSMLRTPMSYKDNHMCKWITPGADFTHSVLTNTSQTEELIAIAPECVDVKYDSIDGVIGKALGLVCSHPKVINKFAYTGQQRDNMITLKRLAPSYCEVCNREHESIDGYAWVYKNHVYFGCFNADKKSRSVYLGYIGESKEMIVSWKTLRTMFKEYQGKDALSLIEQKNQLQGFETLQQKAQANRIMSGDTYVFDDFKNIHLKTFNDNKEIIEYVDKTIFRIVKGGQNFWITKSYWKEQKHFTELSTCPFQSKSESISFDLVNQDFDPEKPPSKDNQNSIPGDLFKLVSDYRKVNFHKTVDFQPYLGEYKIDPDIFNIFEGYRFPYLQRQYSDVPAGALPWIIHIRDAICNGDLEMANTVIQWFAHIIQKPQQKSYSLIVLGKEGTGKSIMYDIFRKCIGEDLAMQLSKLSDLTQSHNKIVQGRLLVNCNEATNYPSISDVNIVKQFVTDKEFLINPKGCPLYYVNNFSRLLITTNCRFPMRITPDDRRYFCVEMTDKYKNNDAYFSGLVGMLDDKKALEELFNYLANYDIRDFKFNRPLMTPFKREIIGECLDDVYYWMSDVLEDGIISDGSIIHIGDETKVPTDDLWNSWLCWAERTLSKKIKKIHFKKIIGTRDVIGVFGKEVRYRVDGGRTRGYRLNRNNIIQKLRESGLDFE